MTQAMVRFIFYTVVVLLFIAVPILVGTAMLGLLGLQ